MGTSSHFNHRRPQFRQEAHYFIWDEKISEEQLKDPIVEELMSQIAEVKKRKEAGENISLVEVMRPYTQLYQVMSCKI